MKKKNITKKITKNTDEFDLIGKHDPILYLVNLFSKNKGIRSWLLAILFYLITIFIPSIIIYTKNKTQAPNFFEDLPFGIFVYLVIAPIIWFMYYWQIRGFIKMLMHLEKNNVILLENGWVKTHIKILKDNLGKISYSLTILFITILAGFIWVWSTTLSNPFTNSSGQSWIYINRAYLIGIMTPANMVSVYMVLSILLRQIILTSFLYKLVNNNPIELKLFHSDKSNGFAPIGIYILRISMLFVIFGFWFFAAFAYPMLYGKSLNIKIDTVLSLIVYVTIVPTTITYFVSGTHTAMVRFKQNALNLIAEQIQDLMAKNNQQEIIESKEILEELYKRHEILERELKTYPFPKIRLRNYIISSGMPLLSTVFSYIFDKYFEIP